MQQWEYLTIFIKDTRWAESLGRSGSLPYRLNMATGDPTGLLNELGEQGWELAGVADRDGWDTNRLFLKRSRP